MKPEDFFAERDSEPLDPLDGTAPAKLNVQLLLAIRQAKDDRSDIEVAVALARLVHDELQSFGTDGLQRTNEEEIRLSLRTLKSLLDRIPIEWSVPFTDFATFHSHWRENDCINSWQARRDLLNKLFGPLHAQLAQLEDGEIESNLTRPVTPHSGTGWPHVDADINELRRHFQIARTAQDYRNIGNDCIAILEQLSRQVYSPSKHLQEGQSEPPVANTKQRLTRFIEVAAGGSENREIRKVARAVIELAQAIKHRSRACRRDAGIAADSVIQLANLLRRLDEDQ